MKAAPAVLLAVLAGCQRYADFTLPHPRGDNRPIRWEWSARPEPVLTRGAPGEWDSSDALNPAITRHDGEYWNLYSGFDGRAWHTGVARSGDGITWSKSGRVLSPDPQTWEGGYIAANGALLRWRGEFAYWYQAGSPPRIGLARSVNGRDWHKAPRPVLDRGPRGTWDERGVADPYVIQASGRLYLFFLGQDRARRQRLGVAVSEDGIRWTKLRSNPVLELGAAGSFDENGLGEPAVWEAHGHYWMLYTGRDRRERRRLGLASSSDGVVWQKAADFAPAGGEQAWNREVVCDPEVDLLPDGNVRVWFGGGDQARPDERLNGQIGTGLLSVRR